MRAYKWVCCVSIVFSCFIISCEKDNVHSELAIDASNFSFDGAGGEETLNIESNSDWSVEIVSGNYGNGSIYFDASRSYNQCDWLSVYPTKGNGNGSVKVKVTESDAMSIRDAVVIVRTTDGKVTKNLYVGQAGILGDEHTLEVWPQTGHVFSGKAKAVDSLFVISNLVYTINGPDWLEIKINDEDWKPLSETGSRNTGKGWAFIYLRTRSANEDMDTRKGVLTIKEDVYLNKTEEIPVQQIGKYTVHADRLVATSDGFACNWIFGCGVTDFYVRVFEGAPQSSDLKWLKIKKWDKFSASDDLVVSWGGLQADTYYKIVTAGIDSNDNHGSSATGTGYFTGINENQPLAEIQNIKRESNGWYWETTMNEYAVGYYQLVYNGTDLDNMPNAYIKWIISNNKSDYEEYSDNMLWNYPTNENFHIATLARDDEKSSDIISRFSSANSSLKASSKEVRAKGLKSSIIKRNVKILIKQMK